MAECITSSSPSYCPQVKLVVTESTHDDISFTFAWTLSYVAHGYALSTDGAARSYTVKIDGELAKSGSRDINGVTGTIQLASGTYKVSKHSKARDVSFSCSFDFNATFSRVAMGTRTASGSYGIPATTSYTIDYNANEGSGAPSAQTKWHSVALTLSSTKPTRTGYTFVEWVATNGTHYNPGDSFTQNNNSTLTAQWKKITYSVTYNANGGSGAPSNQTKTYGTSLTLSSTKPTRTGYTFVDWVATNGTHYNPGDSFTQNNNSTLTAQWKKITYSVTYNANGGSGAPSNQTKTYGQTLTLSSTRPIRANYNFMGWARSSTGSVAYAPGSVYRENAAITLYAIWELASQAPSITNFISSRMRIKDNVNLLSDTNASSLEPVASFSKRNFANAFATNIWTTREFIEMSNKPSDCDATFGIRMVCDGTKGENYRSGLLFYNNPINLNKGTYTASFYARVESGTAKARSAILKQSDPTQTQTDIVYHNLTSQWQRFQYTFTLDSDDGIKIYLGNVYSKYDSVPFVGTVYMIGWKLEEGVSATEWTKSLADVEIDGDFQSVFEKDQLNGTFVLSEFDFSFDQSAGANYGSDIYYMLSTQQSTVHLDENQYNEYTNKTSGHIKFLIENVTFLTDSLLYLTVSDTNNLSTTQRILIYAGRYYIDYYDDPNGDVGVSIGMPASKDGFHVGPWAQFHKNIYMKPDHPETEADIYFETGPGGQYSHKTSIYGASSDSLTALGAWDNKNGRRIWNYLDEENILFFGDDPRIYRTAIPQNANLNDYLTPGHYVCGTNTPVGTLSNLPSGLSNAFQMDVINTLSVTSKTSSYMKAVLTDYFGNQWINVKNGSWGGWKRIMWYNNLHSAVRPCLEYYVITNQKYSITTTLSLVATLTIGDSGKMKLISVNHAYTDKKPMEIAWGPGSSSNISGVTAAPSSGTPHPLQVIGMTTEDTIKIYARAASAASNNISVHVVPLGN